MRTTIIFLVAMLWSSITATAQNSYYYSGGEQIQLSEIPGKFVTISPVSEDAVTLGSSFAIVDSVTDANSRIIVYEFSPSAYTLLQAKEVARQGNSGNMSVYSCYCTADSMELVPTGYIYIKLQETSHVTALNLIAGQYNLEVVSQNEFMPLWYTLRQTSAATMSPLETANAIHDIEVFAECLPDFSFDGLECSYDPDVHQQWGLYNKDNEFYDISVSPAWDYATGKGVKIAIIDSGIERTHIDLAANMDTLSYDTETGTSPSVVYDNNNHGTHCAGIAAAVRNNGIQVAGVAPDAKIISISNNLHSSSLSAQRRANGINWAWKNGADIISCSWKANKNIFIEDAIDSAIVRGRNNKGCIFVKSAGNSSGAITYPGNYRKEVLVVANMMKNGAIHPESCYGDNMFVAAPGDNILSTVLNNQIGIKSGTSMAAPHVAGVAALVLERNPNLTAYQVRDILARSAKKIGDYEYDTEAEFGIWNERYGYGLIDAYNAVKLTPKANP